MPESYIDITIVESTNEHAFSFPYIEEDDIYVKYGSTEIPQNQTTVVTSPSTAVHVFTDSGKTVAYDAIPDTIVRVYRKTDYIGGDSRKFMFGDGSVLTAADLNSADKQLFYLVQESYDYATASLQEAAADSANKWDAQDKTLSNLSDALDSSDAITKSQLESSILAGTGTTPQCFSFSVGYTATEIGEDITEIDKEDTDITSTDEKRIICSVGGVYQLPVEDFSVEVVGEGFKITINEHIATGNTLDYPVSLQITY